MHRIASVCQMCSGQCGIYVLVENGAIIDLEGIPDHPVSKGFICAKGKAGKELVTDPRRVRYPLKRIGGRGEGRWQRVSWEDALGEIAERLLAIKDAYGPRAIAYHRGHASEWESNWDFVIRFMNVLGSPTLSTNNHLCHVPRMLAHRLTYGAMPAPDYEQAQCILLWGTNPAASRPYNAARILAARERGALLIVVDARRNEIAAMADLFLQVRPGSDGALALGMLNIIIQEKLYDQGFTESWTIGLERLAELVKDYPPERVEELTRVPTELIIKATKLYATTKPACLQDGNGLDQHTNVVNTTRAIACLRALTGNLDIPGGNVFLSGFRTANLTLGYLKPELSPLLGQYPLLGQGRYAMVTPPILLQAIAAGEPEPVHALIVQGAALVASSSDSRRVAAALKKLDLLVVHEQYLTHTALLADFVLPASSYLERYLLYTYFAVTMADGEDYHVVYLQRPVCQVGECRTDQEFIFALARKLGFGAAFPWSTNLEALRDLLAPTPVTVEELIANPWVLVPAGKRMYRKYMNSGFATPSGKVELWSQTCAAHNYDGLPVFREPAESPYSTPEKYARFPLIANTGLRLAEYTQTMFRTLPSLYKEMPQPWVEIHPQTAAQYGIANGDTVIVESERGQVKLRARVTTDVLPEVLFLSYGWGQPYAVGLDDQVSAGADANAGAGTDATGANTYGDAGGSARLNQSNLCSPLPIGRCHDADASANANLNLLTDGAHFDPISGTTANRSILVRLRKI
ncbi:molybdopterin-dependent oxidoreductase [Moorella naiadis]|uniref:molybdopterin-containing oxidoreductase family protein n=1 Tax=Moorella naiadis (nom. illeg.) TaxID=3093670 RepID=UPI003D9CB214